MFIKNQLNQKMNKLNYKNFVNQTGLTSYNSKGPKQKKVMSESESDILKHSRRSLKA